MIHIPESDFRQHTTRQLQRLAADLNATGLTVSEISRITRMNWDTVYKALNRRPVRFDNAERLRYLTVWLREQQAAEQAVKPAQAPEQKASPKPKPNPKPKPKH